MVLTHQDRNAIFNQRILGVVKSALSSASTFQCTAKAPLRQVYICSLVGPPLPQSIESPAVHPPKRSLCQSGGRGELQPRSPPPPGLQHQLTVLLFHNTFLVRAETDIYLVLALAQSLLTAAHILASGVLLGNIINVSRL